MESKCSEESKLHPECKGLFSSSEVEAFRPLRVPPSRAQGLAGSTAHTTMGSKQQPWPPRAATSSKLPRALSRTAKDEPSSSPHSLLPSTIS